MKRELIVFPALAIVVAVGCASASDAQPKVDARKSTTTVVSKKKTTTTTVVKGSIGVTESALTVLQSIPVAKERPQGYLRTAFKHWIDADGDTCNTREEVLIAESLSTPQVDAFGCKVIEGDWYSTYEGATFTSPGSLDIDHVVPLKEAWDSGAWQWSASRRQLFANDLSDPRSLIAVSASQNRSKSDRDPSNWIPPNSSYLCTYLADWVAIKARWSLSMDQSEYGRIKNLLTRSCATATVAPWGSSAQGTVTQTTQAPSPPDAASLTTVVTTTTIGTASGVAEVNGGRRCKASEFGFTGQYKGIPYICSNTRQDGSPYAAGYFMWRPA